MLACVLMTCLLGFSTQAQTLDELKTAAAQRDTLAALQLAELYTLGTLPTGLSVQPNPQTAEQYLEQAALNGSSEAAVLLGLHHIRGLSGEIDHRSGERWLKIALERGVPQAADALIDLHTCTRHYFLGTGFQPSEREAFRVALIGDSLGSSVACRYLAKAYAEGLGTRRDPQLALAYSQKSAERYNEPSAQLRLGQAYLSGTGRLSVDLPKAQQYFRALEGNPAASLEQKSEADIGLFYVQQLRRRMVNFGLILGSVEPDAMPQLYIRP